MNSEIRTTQRWGKVLWLWDAHAEVGVALEFGLKLVEVLVSKEKADELFAAVQA